MLPVELLPIFTPRELEQLLCGKSAIDVGLLKRVAAYEFMQPTDACVQWLWEVLEEMAPEQRIQFINFCYARWWGGGAGVPMLAFVFRAPEKECRSSVLVLAVSVGAAVQQCSGSLLCVRPVPIVL